MWVAFCLLVAIEGEAIGAAAGAPSSVCECQKPSSFEAYCRLVTPGVSDGSTYATTGPMSVRWSIAHSSPACAPVRIVSTVHAPVSVEVA